MGHGYVLGLPGAAYLTWQGTMLEGRGITPDEEVSLSRELLKQGRDSQLERALEVAERLVGAAVATCAEVEALKPYRHFRKANGIKPAKHGPHRKYANDLQMKLLA